MKEYTIKEHLKDDTLGVLIFVGVILILIWCWKDYEENKRNEIIVEEME